MCDECSTTAYGVFDRELVYAHASGPEWTRSNGALTLRDAELGDDAEFRGTFSHATSTGF